MGAAVGTRVEVGKTVVAVTTERVAVDVTVAVSVPVALTGLAAKAALGVPCGVSAEIGLALVITRTPSKAIIRTKWNLIRLENMVPPTLGHIHRLRVASQG